MMFCMQKKFKNLMITWLLNSQKLNKNQLNVMEMIRMIMVNFRLEWVNMYFLWKFLSRSSEKKWYCTIHMAYFFELNETLNFANEKKSKKWKSAVINNAKMWKCLKIILQISNRNSKLWFFFNFRWVQFSNFLKVRITIYPKNYP